MASHRGSKRGVTDGGVSDLVQQTTASAAAQVQLLFSERVKITLWQQQLSQPPRRATTAEQPQLPQAVVESGIRLADAWNHLNVAAAATACTAGGFK